MSVETPPAPKRRPGRWLLTAVKIVLPLALVAWLAIEVPQRDPEAFTRLRYRPKEWHVLAGGAGLMLAATSLAISRWFLLVRGIGLPFRLADAFRLGFLGYILNFVSLGHMGGDLFKAVALAREQQSRRLEAVGTIVVDRLLGLFGLLVVASAALWGLQTQTVALAVLARGVRLVTLLFMLAAAVILLPDFSRSVWVRHLLRTRGVGRVVQRVAGAIIAYRRRKYLLVVGALMSVGVHLLVATAIFCASNGLFDRTPTLLEHMVISPLASAAGALPIAPAGLGTYEYAMTYLFVHVPKMGSTHGQGVIVALAYRLMTVVIASVGAVYYVWNRRFIRDLLRQPHDEEETLLG